MALVTIEGSITPSTYLPRGKRTTVERTPFVDKLIKRGYVNVVQTHDAVAEVEAVAAPKVAAAKAEKAIRPKKAAAPKVVETPEMVEKGEGILYVPESIPHEDDDEQ